MQPLERMTDKMRESERNPYYRERKRELNHQLYERVQSELAVFHKEMLGKTPEEIYEAAHEIAAKHEIAAAFAHIDFAPVSVKALLKSPNLLNDIYEEWRERGCLPEGSRPSSSQFFQLSGTSTLTTPLAPASIAAQFFITTSSPLRP